MGIAQSCLSSPTSEDDDAVFSPDYSLDGLDQLTTYIEKRLGKENTTDKAEEDTASGVDDATSDGVAYLIGIGRKLLKRCRKHTSEIRSGKTRKAVIDVLKGASQIQLVGAWLSIAAYLLQKVDFASANEKECLQILRYIYGLAKQIKQLKGLIGEEKLHDVADFIFKASVFCASRIKASGLSRFIFSAPDIEEIKALQSELGRKYSDLTLEAVTQLLSLTPRWLPPSQGEHPDAVGIDGPKLKVASLLRMDDYVSIIAVVVHGPPGMGKTTLAMAVFSCLDLTGFKYCFLNLVENCSERDLKKLQKQILKDLFGKSLTLRDSGEGRRAISDACKNASQPLFLFIDNALKRIHLDKLLPEKLSCLPKGSKLLVTTRCLNETDMLDQKDIISRLEYPMNSLPPMEAKRLLSRKVSGNPDANFHSTSDIEGLVRVCGGIPLVLDLVGSKLYQFTYNLSSFNRAIESLKDSLGKGENHLTKKVVDVMYDNLEEDGCKVAFLDIAAFFTNWERHIVGYIVGEMELCTLVGTSLLNIFNCRVQLHDVILRRGRKLSKFHRTTITSPKCLADSLRDPRRLEKVEAIFLTRIADSEPAAISLRAEDLDRMGSLRILFLASGIAVSGSCTGNFENLRCLIVGEGGYSPMELSKLSRLAIFEGRIRSDDKFCELPHSLRRLKVYCLQSLGLDKSFGNLIHLEELFLWQDKQYMTTLPDNFGNLIYLRVLLLCNFKGLISIPESFAQLLNLEELNMSNFQMLSYLPPNFGQLKSLHLLRIRHFPLLKRLSDDFSSLTRVAAIDASGCHLLEEKALDQMLELPSLLMLDIKDSPLLIKRWEEKKEGNPLLVQTKRFEHSMQREDMHNHSVSTALFDGKTRFMNADGREADWSSTFPKGDEKLALLFTCRDLCSPTTKEDCEIVRKKVEELSKEGFQIVYVGLMEQGKESIRETLFHLSQGIGGGASLCAWIAPDHKWKKLFGFSAYEMTWHWYDSQGGVHTYIAQAYIKTRQGKPQVECLELIFPEKDRGEEDEADQETKFEGDFARQFSSMLKMDRFLNSSDEML